jgi:hypothetical protein
VGTTTDGGTQNARFAYYLMDTRNLYQSTSLAEAEDWLALGAGVLLLLLTPVGVLAEQHRRMAEPGSAAKTDGFLFDAPPTGASKEAGHGAT